MIQVIATVSDDDFVITGNVVRHNILPEDDALKIPASVNVPVPVPAGKVAT